MSGESLENVNLDTPINIDENEEASDMIVKKRETVICAFCGNTYRCIGGLKRHLNYCPKNPESTK